MSRKSTRVFDFAYNQQAYCPVNKYLNQKKDGKWTSLPIKKFIEKVNIISRALLSLGFKSGDIVVSYISKNSTEWGIIDVACMQIGVINVSLSSHSPINDTSSAIKELNPKLFFVSDDEAYEKLKQVDTYITDNYIYSFDENKFATSWLYLLELGAKSSGQYIVDDVRASIKASDVATIVYTSGVMGKPKGVVLSHRNIVENIKAMSKSMSVEKCVCRRAMSYLPVSSMIERMAVYYYQFMRYEVYFSSGESTLETELREVSPHIMNTASRQLEEVYDNILFEINNSKKIKKAIYKWALGLTKKFNASRRNNLFYRLKLSIADKLVFYKWREMLGGEMKFLLSFGSKLNSELVKAFNAADIPLIKSYGTTESAMMISFNDLRKRQFEVQSIGKPINDADVQIAHDGEIIVKSPGVMLGYYKNEKRTSEVMKNGYYHTGDMGKLDRDGFLTVLGRKSRIVKTIDKNIISSMRIENFLKKSVYIQEVAVFAKDFNSPVAMIQPNFRFLEQWVKKNVLNYTEKTDNLLSLYEVQELLEEEIKRINSELEGYERISNFELSPFEWSVENGLLTTTMVVKHDAVKATSVTLFGSRFKKIDMKSKSVDVPKTEEKMLAQLFETPIIIARLEEIEEPVAV
jgi:long-chain acyl-CoA synthetase